MIRTAPLKSQNAVVGIFKCVQGVIDHYAAVTALLVLGRLSAFQDVLKDFADGSITAVAYLEQLGSQMDISEVQALQEHIHTIANLHPETLHSLHDKLQRLDLPSLSQEAFISTFDFALDFYLQYFTKADAGEFPVPAELVELVASIYPIHAGERVYNPFAGTAQLISFLPPSVEYKGIEPSQHLASLAALRLIAYKRIPVNVVSRDHTENWLDEADWHFICNSRPVIPSRFSQSVAARHNAGAILQVDIALINQTLAHLSADGRAVLIVAQSFLNRVDTLRFRQQLLRQDWLESIIELPAGILLPYTSVSLALLTFNVIKLRTGEILFLDAEQFTVAGHDRRRILQVDKVLEALRQPETTLQARYVPLDQIEAQEFNMMPRRYTRGQETSPLDIKLGKLVEIINGKPLPIDGKPLRLPPAEGPLLAIRSMLADNLNFQLNYASLQAAPQSLRNAYMLDEQALLLALDGGKLKPTWFAAQQGEQLFVQRNIVALRVNASKVDLAYLVSELNSDYVVNQVKALQVGSTLPHLAQRDLLQLRVRIPKLAEQRASVNGARSALIKLKEQELAQLRATHEQKAEAFELFALLKHSLGRPLANINSGLRRLQGFIEKHGATDGSLTLESMLSQRAGDTVGQTFASLKQELQFVHQRLVRSEEHMLLEQVERKPVNLLAYLDSLKLRVQNLTTVYELIIKPTFEISAARSLGMAPSKWLHVMASEDLLDRLFNHILDNAERHGFHNRRGADAHLINKVIIHISYGYMDDDTTEFDVLIWVKNNGLPFPDGFDPKTLTQLHATAGDTGNSGIGGFEAREIARSLGGELEVFSNPKQEYQVSYLITLPWLTNNISSEDNDDDSTLQGSLD